MTGACRTAFILSRGYRTIEHLNIWLKEALDDFHVGMSDEAE